MALRFKSMSKKAAGQGIDLNLLKREEGIVEGSNLGGQFRLPDEFDTNQWASGFYKKGQEAESKRGRQLLQGMEYSAPGWDYWKFPEGHERAGQHHEVAAADGVYVLMCRPADVQQAINFTFGQFSQDRLNAEVHGETAAGTSPQDGGILTSDRLSHGDASMRAEQRRDEDAGKRTSTFAGQQARSTSKIITKKTKRLSK